MAKQIIIKPLITDKSNALASDPTLNQYTFVVALNANRIEVKNAVEAQFGVEVENVNISIRPGKKRGRVVKGRMTSGRKAPIKKAYVTIKEGQIIESFYGTQEIETNEEAVEANA